MPRRTGDFTRHRHISGPRDRAWTSMRVLRRFTRPQIEATAEISRDNVATYITRLRQTGYLRITTPNVQGRAGSHAVYLLVRDTGPRAPIIRKIGKQAYDPNNDQVYEAAADGGGDAQDR